MNKKIYRASRADSAIMISKIEIDRYYNRYGLELWNPVGSSRFNCHLLAAIFDDPILEI